MAGNMRVKVWLAGTISAVAVVAAAVGCSDNGTGQQAGSEATTPATSAAPATSATRQARPHNEADVMFAHHMIPHHQQAIEMSDILLEKSDIDQRVIDLAVEIKGAQGPEIEQMQAWLKQWGNPPMPPMPSGHMGGDDHGSAGMAGMVSDADMAALRDAQGVDAAKLFLTHMIAHHEGAIDMAQEEVNEGRFSDAVQMARTIVIMQQREVKTMREILDSL
jgi:uncharacterized protein (DUF305 family)